MGRGQTLEDLGGKWEGVKSGFDTVCLLPTNLEVDEEKANWDLGKGSNNQNGKGLTFVQLFGAWCVQKGVGGVFLKVRPHSCV